MESYQEKLDVLAQAIIEARDNAPGTSAFGKSVKLERQPNTPLWQVKPSEIVSFLEEMQTEKAIELEPLPDGPPNKTALEHYKEARLSEVIDEAISDFQSQKTGSVVTAQSQFSAIHLRVLKGFDDWNTKRIMMRDQKLEDLAQFNFENILDAVLDIQEKHEISPSNKIRVSITPSQRFKTVSDACLGKSHIEKASIRATALGYLENKGTIMVLEPIYNEATETANDIEIRVYLDQFRKFKEEIEKAHLKRTDRKAEADSSLKAEATKGAQQPQKKPAEENAVSGCKETVYEIKYTALRQVFLNNFLLVKPDFNSENDNLAQLIFNNPNRKITADELKQLTGGEIKKKLHKVVENLGFKGEIKKAFFDISKDTLYFRNPLTRAMLRELNIESLRFPTS